MNYYTVFQVDPGSPWKFWKISWKQIFFGNSRGFWVIHGDSNRVIVLFVSSKKVGTRVIQEQMDSLFPHLGFLGDKWTLGRTDRNVTRWNVWKDFKKIQRQKSCFPADFQWGSKISQEHRVSLYCFIHQQRHTVVLKCCQVWRVKVKVSILPLAEILRISKSQKKVRSIKALSKSKSNVAPSLSMFLLCR